MDGAAFSEVDVSACALEPDALRRIPRSLALRHDILSLASDGNQITIALPNTNDREAIERVRLATGMHVRALQAPREHIRARLSDAYTDHTAARPSLGRGLVEAPAIQALESIQRTAIHARASDVHIEPARNGGVVRQRIDGILAQARTLSPDLFAQVTSRVKILAGMDIADKRAPQDGRYTVESAGRDIDARVSSMPTIAGEKLVIRFLDHAARVPALDELGMPFRQLQAFRADAKAPYGFIIVAGPTGSGKTTTLYAALGERDAAGENICSVEDPVEAVIPGIAQVQVNPKAGVTFASALRAFLRQDPNVIMVGEMRDAETAGVAAAAALSGQLVLTTLHCNDAPTVLERLVELGVARRTIASGMTAVIAQRLVRKLCPHCKVPSANGGHRAAGCSRCMNAGYDGRTAIFEYLHVDDEMRACIAEGATSVRLAEIARLRGYEPMLNEGLRLVNAGETTIDEIRRVLSLGLPQC